MRTAWIAFFGILCATISLPSRAADAAYARILTQGSVTIDGNSVDRQEEISKSPVEIRTDKDSYAEIHVYGTDSRMTVGPHSVFRLSRPDEKAEEVQILKEGWVRSRIKKRPPNSFRIKTEPAVFGVRGTNFVVRANPVFHEAEVVVFRGVVAASSTDPADSTEQMVKAGFWSGIGGRFGSKMATPMKISTSGLHALEKAWSTPAWSAFPSTSHPAKSPHAHAAGKTGGNGRAAE